MLEEGDEEGDEESLDEAEAETRRQQQRRGRTKRRLRSRNPYIDENLQYEDDHDNYADLEDWIVC
jgi:hypothetical protein